MKKLLILLLLTACTRVIYDTPQKTDRSITVALADVNLGTAPNSGNGDPLRTAFGKVNSNNALIESAFTTVYTETQTETLVNDSLAQLRTDALPLTTYAWLKSDTVSGQVRQVVTQTQLANSLGTGGTSSNRNYYQFITAVTTGAPGNGDTLIHHSSLSGLELSVFRGTDEKLSRIYRNFTATNGITGFRVDDSTVVIRPALATNDRILVVGEEPVITTWLSPNATGGSSSLITNLAAYFKFDETSGVLVDDVMNNVLYATQSGTNNQTGLLGKAVALDGTTQAIETSYYAAVQPAGAFSVSVWVYLDVIPSVKGHGYYAFGMPQGTAPYNAHNIQIRQADNKVLFTVTNTSSTEFTVESTNALAAGAWYHIVGVCAGTGTALKVYVAAAGSAISDVSASAGTPTGTIYTSPSANVSFGNNYDGGAWGLDGLVDECGIWIGTALSGANITELHTPKTHPFN